MSDHVYIPTSLIAEIHRRLYFRRRPGRGVVRLGCTLGFTERAAAPSGGERVTK